MLEYSAAEVLAESTMTIKKAGALNTRFRPSDHHHRYPSDGELLECRRMNGGGHRAIADERANFLAHPGHRVPLQAPKYQCRSRALGLIDDASQRLSRHGERDEHHQIGRCSFLGCEPSAQALEFLGNALDVRGRRCRARHRFDSGSDTTKLLPDHWRIGQAIQCFLCFLAGEINFTLGRQSIRFILFEKGALRQRQGCRQQQGQGEERGGNRH